jgi:hypothetical protein
MPAIGTRDNTRVWREPDRSTTEVHGKTFAGRLSCFSCFSLAAFVGTLSSGLSHLPEANGYEAPK